MDSRPGTRVIIFVGCRLYGDGLACMLRAEPAMTVLGVVTDCEAALLLARVAQADVLLADVATPHQTAVIGEFVRQGPAVHVVGLGIAEEQDAVIAAAEAGVAAFLGHEADFAQLRATIDSAKRGEMLCSPRVAAILRQHVTALALSRRVQQSLRTRLTAREIAIMALVEDGLSNREIAHRLCIEVSTVKNHLRNVFEKLQVGHRAEAVARLRRRSDEEPPDLPDRSLSRASPVLVPVGGKN